MPFAVDDRVTIELRPPYGTLALALGFFGLAAAFFFWRAATIERLGAEIVRRMRAAPPHG